MKFTTTTLALVAALTVLLAAVSVVSGKGICGMSQEELMSCKEAAASGTAVPPAPTQGCCKALGHADLKCLCSFKNNAYIPLLGINATRAMELPSLCTDPTTLPPKPVACGAN